MSYLPRMSKTYKEPEDKTHEEPAKEITFNSIKIASAQPDEKAYSPQSVLKQYSYYPHPPPVLPGPSLIQEAEENEKISIEAKRRRSREESESKINESIIENIDGFPFEPNNQKPTVSVALVDVKPTKFDCEECVPSSSRKLTKITKTPKKAPSKVNKIREEGVKPSKCQAIGEMLVKKKTESKSPLNVKKRDICQTNEVSRSATCENSILNASSQAKNVKSDSKRHEELEGQLRENNFVSPIAVKGSINEGIQCSPTSGSEKIFVMPSCIHYIMKTLSFLVQELDKSEADGKSRATKEMKKLLAQINEAITALSSRKIDGVFALQTSLSDRKRLEKICSDLERYIQDVYGENGKLGCKSEERKRLYCKLLQKEYELNVLNEKLRESEIQNPSLRQMEPMTKPPEVLLQNKNLENEQLRAEVEFNLQEMKKFHQTLAEKNWEIHKFREEISVLRRKLAMTKSKIKK